MIKKTSSYDSFFVLLPGSQISKEGVSQLSAITELEPYTIQTKLRSSLPQNLCTCKQDEISGKLRDALESSGINFMVVHEKFLNEPFKPFSVTSCQFEEKKIRFFDKNKKHIAVETGKELLLLEGLYRTNIQGKSLADKRDGDIEKKSRFLKKNPLSSSGMKTNRVIMVYIKNKLVPIYLNENNLDYSFLGSSKEMTVLLNFNIVRDELERTFKQPINRVMLENSIALEQTFVNNKEALEIVRSKESKKTSSVTSNESSTNLMSRLLFFKWCKENGWSGKYIT